MAATEVPECRAPAGNTATVNINVIPAATPTPAAASVAEATPTPIPNVMGPAQHVRLRSGCTRSEDAVIVLQLTSDSRPAARP